MLSKGEELFGFGFRFYVLNKLLVISQDITALNKGSPIPRFDLLLLGMGPGNNSLNI